MLRVLAAAAIIVAIAGQFVQSWSMVPDRLSFVVNFFSFFTILSNALTALVLLVGAWVAFTRPDEKGSWRIRLVFHEEGTFSPGGFVHLACRKPYFETDDIARRLLHFSPGLDESARNDLLRELSA